jgi:hypothetical protein
MKNGENSPESKSPPPPIASPASPEPWLELFLSNRRPNDWKKGYVTPLHVTVPDDAAS